MKKFNFKKIAVVGLAAIIAASAMSISAFAEENNDTYHNFIHEAELLENSNPSPKEIQEFFKKYKDEIDTVICDPEQVRKDLITEDVDPEPVIGDVSKYLDNNSKYRVSDNLWNNIKEVATKGNILITKYDQTPAIDHGHTAIVLEDCSKTVEILGIGYTSDEYNIDRWKEYPSIKLVYPSSADFETRKKAASRAYVKYINWKYAALPDVDSDKYLNCATLVWRSYNDVGITLGKLKYSASPQSILQGPGNIVCKAYANWEGGTNW